MGHGRSEGYAERDIYSLRVMGRGLDAARKFLHRRRRRRRPRRRRRSRPPKRGFLLDNGFGRISH